VILYQGTVAEAGSVDRVIREPKHPYTQLLVSSIPLPDRTRSWGGEELKIPEASAGRIVENGCRFAPRCPYVMEQCWKEPPPKYRLDPDRMATCFLYRDRPISPEPDVAAVFHRPQNAAVAGVLPASARI
jgi:oligopeptide/dipeptide ABC transporter ATP-binding protein